MKQKIRKHLSMPGLLSCVRSQFSRIDDPLSGQTKFSLVDCLMSGLALFGMKYASLLKFDEAYHQDEVVKHNLKSLYRVRQAPSDTYFRERLDTLAPYELQRAINRMITQLQRGKVLETYRFYEDYYLVSIDGTGYFSSHDIHCDSCCVKQHREGSVTYYHQMLAAVMVHPDYKTVFPLAIEPVHRQDGHSKNDCEHVALGRLLASLRRAHPHLKIIVTLDALYADGPTLKQLDALNMKYIVTARESDCPYLFEFYRTATKATAQFKVSDTLHDYTWGNGLPLNDTHADYTANVLHYQEQSPKRHKRFCWLVNITLSKTCVSLMAKGGRARWHIENETFNTLKNQGYYFSHNFGHGHHSLSNVMAYLMFLAFLIDQVQEFSCCYFKAALKKMKRKLYLWEKLRGLFLHYLIDSWEQLYQAVIQGFKPLSLAEVVDTS